MLGQGPQRNTIYCLPHLGILSYISYTAQAHQSSDGATHRCLGPGTSIINKDTDMAVGQ